MVLPILVVAPSKLRGRGVFSTATIPAHTVVEISPVLVLDAAERKLIEQTHLFDYIFEWGDDYKSACIGLGYLSLYNHAYNANCEYEMDYANDLMTITTVKNVSSGEELFINYNAVHDDETPIWFEAK